MGDDDSGEKTEEPTPHKMQEARKKGQVTKSKDVTSAILLIVSFYSLSSLASGLWSKLSGFTVYVFSFISADLSPSVFGKLMQEAVSVFFSALGPMFFIVFLVAVVVEVVQTGFVFSFEPMSPELSKLDPIEGTKKMFALKQYVELFKSIIKMSVVIYMVTQVIKDNLPLIAIAQEMTLWQVVDLTGDMVMTVILRVGLFYLIIGLLDYMYQRYEFIKGLKMSKKEIKDEYKRLEGDPTVKQRQKQAQREMSQGRQMGAVPDADVVVTNPTHIACALKYNPNKMKAPILVAKGKRLIAETIKRIAEENKIPIVQNKPLAQGLYKETEIDMPIPSTYYRTVAEILAFIYKLKKKKKNRENL